MKHVIMGVLLIPLLAVSVSAQDNWVMSDYDAMRTSWVRSETQFAPPLTMTKYEYPEPLASTAGFKSYQISYSDGVAYLGIGAGPIGNAVTAFDYKNGTLLWTTTIVGGGGSVGNDPVITSSRVICGGQGQAAMLTGMDRTTGAVVWTRSIGSMYGRELTLSEGRLYISTDSTMCLDPETGDVYWKHLSYNTQGGTPAVNNTIMAYVSDRTAHVRNKSTGELLWSRDGVSREGMTIDEQTMYVPANDTILALDLTNGSVLWRHDVPEGDNIGFLAQSLARTDDILLYALWENPDTLGVIRALDISTGAVLWTYTGRSEGVLEMTIVNGIVWFTDWGNHDLIGVRLSDGEEVERMPGPMINTRMIFGDRMLFGAYIYDPLLGGGVVEYRSSAVATETLSAPHESGVQVFPNPAVGYTQVRYTLPAASSVGLRVYDALGRLVTERSLGRREAGMHTMRLGPAELPAALPAGIYRVVVNAGSAVMTKNLILRR